MCVCVQERERERNFVNRKMYKKLDEVILKVGWAAIPGVHNKILPKQIM